MICADEGYLINQTTSMLALIEINVNG